MEGKETAFGGNLGCGFISLISPEKYVPNSNRRVICIFTIYSVLRTNKQEIIILWQANLNLKHIIYIGQYI